MQTLTKYVSRMALSMTSNGLALGQGMRRSEAKPLRADSVQVWNLCLSAGFATAQLLGMPPLLHIYFHFHVNAHAAGLAMHAKMSKGVTRAA